MPKTRSSATGSGEGLTEGDGLTLGEGLTEGDGLTLGEGLTEGDGLTLGEGLGNGGGVAPMTRLSLLDEQADKKAVTATIKSAELLRAPDIFSMLLPLKTQSAWTHEYRAKKVCMLTGACAKSLPAHQVTKL